MPRPPFSGRALTFRKKRTPSTKSIRPRSRSSLTTATMSSDTCRFL
nr:MAG TPA: hypothetical protein [Caudoviricetes sp.]